MTRKPTIWENLVRKLGRDPTNAECREECHRIMQEVTIEQATQGKLAHQRKRKGTQ